ncbi:hypothetical protein AXJ14_gp177 [Geobacillus virus E3]|uniref:hypothetical protein n=1 Tax=Geobacillus virus E3 TaxID=1572712 RepID=UPI000671864D|nr:hypothetical protein AXJ14_gp177 [Geobacillus virus E3]AJA41496.1 hypothetical protein E3_0177 [Geobacillus virus E3]
MTNLALKLIEGTKEDRDKYIHRVDVLDKVKQIITLPDGYVESKKVAEYYEVNPSNLRMLLMKNRAEFEEDGVITLTGKEFQEYKNKLLASFSITLSAKSNVTLYTRRGILRMGMLLESSRVADQIKNYLLNVEENATKEQKEIALSYTGVWTDELDDYVFNSVKNKILSGKMVIEAIRETANEINTSEHVLRNRWYVGNRNRKPLKDRLTPEVLKVIEENKALALSIYSNHNTNNDEKEKCTSNSINERKIYEMFEKHFTNQNKIILDLTHELKEVKASNTQLHKDMGTLWRAFQEVLEQQQEIKEDINSINETVDKLSNYIDTKVNEEINVLKNKVTALNKKIKLKEQENDELLKFIGKSSVLSNAFMDKEKESIKLKIDKFGNVEKI